MRVLIIGSKGYIGSALLHFLNGFADGIDIKDGFDYANLTREDIARYSAIILLAGNSSVQSCNGDPLISLDNNVVKFLRLLKLIDKQKFIYASSSSVYGNTENRVANEEYPLFTPTTNYDLTKHIIDCYAALSSVEYYGLRFGTVNGRYGGSNVVRSDIMINAMVKNAIETGVVNIINPRINRPILDIRDLCRAILCIIMGEYNRGYYNLASYNTTVGEAGYAVACSIPGTKVEVQNNNITTYDFKIGIDKMSYRYGFKPQYQIKDTIQSLLTNYQSIEFTKGS